MCPAVFLKEHNRGVQELNAPLDVRPVQPIERRSKNDTGSRHI